MIPRARSFVHGETLDVERPADAIVNPFDGTKVAEVDRADLKDLEKAIHSASLGYDAMRKLPAHARAEKLLAVAGELRKRKLELAEAITRSMGKPITYALAEVDRAATTFTLAGEEARRFGGETLPLDVAPAGEGYRCMVERFPTGPVAAIGPFNFPLNLLAHKVAPALAVGASVVIKPPPQAPTLGIELARICHQVGFPAGAVNALHLPNDLAEKLATDPRIRHMTFTGSVKVGWHLKKVCQIQKVTLELGGNAAAIVHQDADLEWALKRTVLGSFAASGQVCIKVQRVLVHAPIYEEFTERFVLGAQGLPGGDPMKPDSVFGAMVDRPNALRVMEWVEEAVEEGATLRCGGRREGAVVYPTVLTGVAPGMRVRDEEIFGPVTVIEPYAEFEEALALANDSIFGLQAGVFTRDIARAFRAFEALEVGGVIVNDYPTFRMDNYPYGGIKASGLGREGVRYAMEDMTELRALVLNLNVK